MKIKELKGYPSIRAYAVYQRILLGLLSIPAVLGIAPQDFIDGFEDKPRDERRILLIKACAVMDLSDDEIDSLLYFAVDNNGVALSRINTAALGPKELTEVIVEVCLMASDAKVHSLTKDQKKN